jgi:hypothetical protein
MKLTNHNKDNYHYTGDCVTRGTITMNVSEWTKVLQFFLRQNHLYNDYRKMKIDIAKPFCIGITDTKRLCQKFNLSNYKDINYRIVIK